MTSAWAHDFSYLSDEGKLSYSLMWHDRFGNINYDILLMLKKNDVSSLPTIPRSLKQCIACILGKHSKQPFHDSTLRECRKLE